MQDTLKCVIVSHMRPPVFVRDVSPEEETTLGAGLRSSNSFTLRRCQIILASRKGRNAREIGEHLGCSDQTVRTAITAVDTIIEPVAHHSRSAQNTHAHLAR